MVNNSIVQGIKMAVERGSTLQDAMISFYNAGYPKEEIEEAARIQQMGDKYTPEQKTPVEKVKAKSLPTDTQTPQPTTPQPPQEAEQTTTPGQPQTPPAPAKPDSVKKPQTSQKVSQYGNKKRKENTKITIIILSIILILLLGGLAILFLFKSPIIDFFNGTF